MQGRRVGLDSFRERFDLNQGSFHNNNSMDRSASWGSRLSPVESRISNHLLTEGNGNISCMSATNIHGQRNRGWDHGESSSNGNYMQEQARDSDSKTRLALYSFSGAHSETDLRSEDWSSEPSSIRSTSYASNQMTDRSWNMQNYSSTRSSLNLSLNQGRLRENNHHTGLGAGQPCTLNKSGHSRTEQIQTFHASCSNIRTSSGSSSNFEDDDASAVSSCTSGLSCKRKSLEGTSGHFYRGGSSNSNQPVENIMQHSVPGCCTAPRNLSISSSISFTNHLEQLNSRSGVGTSRVWPGQFSSSSGQGIAGSSVGNFASRSSAGHRESVLFGTPRGTSVRHSTVYAAQPLSQPISNSNNLELMSPMSLQTNHNRVPNQSLVHVNEARGAHSNSWSGSFGSRHGSSSSSFLLAEERGSGTHEEVNIGSSLGNNSDYPVILPASETRSIFDDQIDWSFTPGTSVSSRNYSSGSRIGWSSDGQSSSTAWLPHQNHTSQDRQRSSEAVPWIPFPRIESDFGTERSPFRLLPLASSSSDDDDDMATTSQAQHQFDQRSAAFLMDMAGGDTNGWNVLAAAEGRHRLIHQVLNAMQRGVHLRAEENILIDPSVNGFAELHDRHRDMRLDVDNMSYEELLALEERIGNVSTGLSEEKIKGFMKQRKYETMGASPDMEPCCICQGDYVAGDDIGILDCGHEFHTSCIKQWLMLKNTCPICKMTALET